MNPTVTRLLAHAPASFRLTLAPGVGPDRLRLVHSAPASCRPWPKLRAWIPRVETADTWQQRLTADMAQVWRARGNDCPPSVGGDPVLGRPLGPGDLAPFAVVATDGYRALAVDAGPVSGRPVLPGLRQSPHSVRLEPADHLVVRRASVATAWIAWLGPVPRLDLAIDPAGD